MSALLAKAEDERLPYILTHERGEALDVSDSLFYEIARSVVFPVNRYEIHPSNPFYAELEVQLRLMRTEGYGLDSIMMRGAASPEGPLYWNIFLSQARRQALFDLIKRNNIYTVTDSLVAMNHEEAEDYIYLLRVMERENDPDYDRVKAVVDRYYGVDLWTLKRQLRALDGGQLWRRLLLTYFPELRAARIVLIFSHVTPRPRRLEPLEPAMPQLEAPQIAVPYRPSLPSLRLNLFEPRRELLAVKTNVLFDVAYVPGYNRWCPIPNVALEYYPLHGHFTFGASMDFPWWQSYWDHKYFQVRNYQLEARYYRRSGDILTNRPGQGAAFRGLYFQAYANAGLYSVCFDQNRGWEGEGVGGGLGIGYVLPLGRSGHWKLEFSAQVGAFWTVYDPYQWECPVDHTEHDHLYYYKTKLGPSLFKRRDHNYLYLGPTRIGITISYDLLYRKNKGKGASFRPWEEGVVVKW